MTWVMLPLQRAVLYAMRSQILAKLLHHHRFVISPVADAHLCNGFAFEGDDMGADSME